MLRKPLIIVVALVASLLVVFLFILPKKDAWKNLETAIKEKSQILKNREDYFKELENASTSLQDYQDELTKIKLALPEGPQVLVFYDFMQKATSRSGLVLKSINHNVEQAGTVVLDLGLGGTLEAFKNFLVILEKSARMIDVESFSFISPEKEKDAIDFNLKIKASFIE